METGGSTRIQVSVESEKQNQACVSSLFFTLIPSLPNSSIEWLRLTVQCDMGFAAAVMAWSSPDCGFAEVHMTTEAPAILW